MSESLQKRLNWIVIGAVVVLLFSFIGWMARQVHVNTVALGSVITVDQFSIITTTLSKLEQKVDDGKVNRIEAHKENQEDHKRIFQKLDDLVSRAEFTREVASIRAELAAVKAELSALKSEFLANKGDPLLLKAQLEVLSLRVTTLETALRKYEK
jgi:hypothetical protein